MLRGAHEAELSRRLRAPKETASRMKMEESVGEGSRRCLSSANHEMAGIADFYAEPVATAPSFVYYLTNLPFMQS